MPPSIYNYIKQQEATYQTEEIKIGDNWNWNMRNHVQMIFHLKNGVFFTGQNDWLRAFKNIMEPILNLCYWMEDIELKDVVFFIENRMGRVLSFFIKKYHDEVYVKEHNLDTLFDEIAESDIDYGGSLLQDSGNPDMEVLALNDIAFCNQTNILGGAIAFRKDFSPSELRPMGKKGWGNEKNGADISIEDLIVLAEAEQTPSGQIAGKENKTTIKNIEVYIVRGDLPDHYLKDNNDMEYYCKQIQIRAFYTTKEGKQEGVCLYRKEDKEESLFFHSSKKVHRRALGRGTGEALLHPQIWENFLTIHRMNSFEAGSKNALYTDDPSYTNRNKIQEMEQNEITTVEDGKKIYRVPTLDSAQIQLFATGIEEWYQHAQLAGSAFDPVLGKEANSGTTFRGQERVVQQGRGMHDRRRGQRAKFIEELYRKRFIPDMVKQITKGKEFLATLTSEEMGWVSEQLAENYASRTEVDMVLDGKLPQEGITFEQLREVNKQKFLKDFSKKGNKHLLEILKDEFKDVEVKIGINVSGKQKDLAGMSDKLLSVIQFIFANPQGFQQAMQLPGMAKAFADILEFSGISQADFSAITKMPIQPMMQPGQMEQPQLMQPTA